MPVTTYPTAPIDGQVPGTSGLRKKTQVFSSPGYLETYVQAVLNAIGAPGKTLVLGGDGRFFNDTASAIILRMAAANGVAKVIVGQNGILSTPAASHLIRLRKADGGIILSASHNPGGPDGDFGLKYNIANGGPAPESVTDEIVSKATTITEYHMTDTAAPSLSQVGTLTLDGMTLEVVDPVEDYAVLMDELFEMPAIRALFASGFRMRFDAMHAVTGPYAKEILVNRLGAHPNTVLNGAPLKDFGAQIGGGHPDPNPVWAKPLYDLMMDEDAPDFAAASDGDGDRNMILGRDIYVTPSDSLAVLAANADLAPGYAGGINGIARSMPTSGASDRVAKKLGIEAFQTPTGWKYFGTLLDAGRATLCGEESAGTGSNHVREKDGLWAVLLWLNILAVRRESVADILTAHWAEFGRNYYSRHDYEAVDSGLAEGIVADLRARLDTLAGTTAAGSLVTSAEEFAYTDPVDGSHTTNQGLIISFEGGARAMLRLSGTGTEGATIRVYLENYAGPEEDHSLDAQVALKDVIAATEEITGIRTRTGRDHPDVIS
ncbi:alpha-D-glucose phosphate-specific phosphoglucomutase [Aliiroseovarius lamellibrachiae]|uniref:alpha-D-glucose phosphate-specific phosphoglucomutase n=1 Tax=Aliiroseovarius lamellibrachiae TaxID=1924933 RepID=UPI001BE11B9B|nr:alpha-D-glucose phosphate-specific phosphoglucomutase [Aliiroseovarius lamellibrachiae]MBT2130037.1 alpha-D-glucose phosphate-specific phosphoglucomutase [Aliiroseovarius lamellibrachiae]